MAEKTSAFYRTGFIVGFTFAIPGIRYVVIGWYNYQSGRLLRSFSLVTLNIGKGCCNVTELLRARRYGFAIIYRLSTTASVDIKHRGFFSVKLLHYIIEKVVRKAPIACGRKLFANAKERTVNFRLGCCSIVPLN